MTLGEQITAARERAGLSMIELAAKAGVDPATVNQIEKGHTKRPHKSTIELIERALNEAIEGGIYIREEPTAPPFNPRFKLCREATGHEITEAAKMLGHHPKTLDMIERGTRTATADTVAAMARLYRVSTDFLLGFEADPFKGRSCMITNCEAGQFHDHCCADCPRRGKCGYACKNSPDSCRCVRVLSPERIAKIRQTKEAQS